MGHIYSKYSDANVLILFAETGKVNDSEGIINVVLKEFCYMGAYFFVSCSQYCKSWQPKKKKKKIQDSKIMWVRVKKH